MPKKNKKEEKPEESELEDILDEEKFKEIIGEMNEDSEINFSNEESFPEFIRQGGTAPVLEQIAGGQGTTWVRREGEFVQEEKEGGIKYDFNSKYGNPKGDKYESGEKMEFEGITISQLEHIEEFSSGKQFDSRRDLPVNTEVQKLRRNEEKTEQDYFSAPEKIEENQRLPFESLINQKRKYKL